MQINQIQEENSGIMGGTFLRRHQIPKPGKRGEYYKWEDLQIGEDVEMYGVTYHIVDCDQFTRVCNFYQITISYTILILSCIYLCLFVYIHPELLLHGESSAGSV